jgi:CheY-like chemotaxis protein
MGGKIWLESEVGAGTQFHFNVKFGLSDSKLVEATPALSPDILRGTKVLVVDDNRTNRQILESLLKQWQMRPTAVESGEVAVEHLISAREAGDSYTLILTDMHMPNMDGFGLIEEIRAKQELSATIMMLTSAGHRGDANHCKQLGVAGYLLKPVRQSELREAITMALGARDNEGTNPLITRYSLRDSLEPPLSLRVLLAEDNEVNQKLAQRLLEKRGHRVTVTNNGSQAVRTLEKQPFDLVLMDMQMPEMDGLEATAAIREKERFSGLHTPIIALIAHAMKGDKERCVAGGMDGYLAKPIRPQELDELLAKYTSRRADPIPTAEIAETT